MAVPAHISRARDRSSRLLTDKVRVQRITGETTAATAPFAVTTTTDTLYAGSALIGAAKPRQRFAVGDDLVAEAEIRVRVPFDASAEVGDQVVVTSTTFPDLSGETLEVVGVDGGSMHVWRHLWCRRRHDNPRR